MRAFPVILACGVAIALAARAAAQDAPRPAPPRPSAPPRLDEPPRGGPADVPPPVAGAPTREPTAPPAPRPTPPRAAPQDDARPPAPPAWTSPSAPPPGVPTPVPPGIPTFPSSAFPGAMPSMPAYGAPPPAPQVPDRFRIEDRAVNVANESGEPSPPHTLTLLFDSATGETCHLVRDGAGYAWRRITIQPHPHHPPHGPAPGGPFPPSSAGAPPGVAPTPFGPPGSVPPGFVPPRSAPPESVPPGSATIPYGVPPSGPSAAVSPPLTGPPGSATNGPMIAPVNPQVDVGGFAARVAEAEGLRERRRVGEEAFLALAEPGSVILDCRSREAFERLHVRGAVNLPFAEITADTLARVVPSPDTRILIYCNNNFANAPEAFPAKVAAAALNHHTFATLLAYGYREIFELGPLVDVARTGLPLEGSDAPGR